MKDKDMILSDFLSRQRVDRSNPHEFIPISFDMKAVLKDKYYNVGNESRYLVQTHAQIRNRGIKLPEVHGVDKGINPDIKPEWLVQKSQKSVDRSKLGQGKENPRREVKSPVQGQTQMQSNEETQVRKKNNIKTERGYVCAAN